MIEGVTLRDALISAAEIMHLRRQEVDALNVFPVPDGDTGTNMSMTMAAAARELALLPGNTDITQVAEAAASALLRGARGNSGVILSLIFRGFAKSLKGNKTIDGPALALALQAASDAAYKAVMKPTEGTILTLIRHAALAAKEAADKSSDFLSVWRAACESSKLTLADTPNLLPVLKKAGVVDAGGQGLVYIFEGMSLVFEGKKSIDTDSDKALPADPAKIDFSAAAHSDDHEITFSYCTEFIIEHSGQKEPLKLRAGLESIGDSLVVVNDDEIIKVHLHTDRPDKALGFALKYGALSDIKIDNMRKQHDNLAAEALGDEKNNESSPTKEFGLVAVAAGQGIKEIFEDLGVDRVISGGQTMNPSTEDILAGVEATSARHIFVLPNNKNIIMAAEQVIPLTDRKVSVLPTKSIPQGLAAILAFDESLPANENHIAMVKAFEKVAMGLVTYAARDSLIDGKKVNKGQILGMEGSKITLIESSPLTAAYKLTRRLFKKNSNSLITIFYGADTTEDRALELEEKLRERYGRDADISLVNGGQPVYYYIISVE